MSTKVKEQISYFDNVVEDAELEQILNERQVLKESVSDYKKSDKKAKEKILEHQDQMPFRIGRFIVSKKTVAAKNVSFETSESSRINIETVDE